MDLEFARWLIHSGQMNNTEDGAYFRLHKLRFSITQILPYLSKIRADDIRLDNEGWLIAVHCMQPVLAAAKAMTESSQKAGGGTTSSTDTADSSPLKTRKPDTGTSSQTDSARLSQENAFLPADSYESKREPRLGFAIWDVLDERKIDLQVSYCDGRSKTRKKKLLEEVVEGSVRHIPIATSHHINAVRDLAVDFPHFEAVIESVVTHLKLQRNTDRAVGFEPILLDGPPGVGKTAFCRALVAAIDGSLYLRSMAEATSGFLFTGNSSQWSDADAGVFAYMLAKEPTERLPVLLLDELDKARIGNFPPDQVLLGVLEPSTAKIFRDEYLQLTLDVSPIPIIATCNRTSTIRPELVSRFHYFYVPAPDREQMPAIIRSVDRALRAERPEFAEYFAPLDEAVVAHLVTATPRELRRQLLTAYANAMGARQKTKRYRVKPAHFPDKPIHPEVLSLFRRLARTDEALH